MKILFIGDIVGEPGRRAIKELLGGIKKSNDIEFVIANAENVAGGSGVTPSLADELFEYGIDIITSGDHIWKRKEILERIDTDGRILRPANYPSGVPGSGSTVVKAESGTDVGVVNLQGRVFMAALECPFRAAKEAVDKISKKARIIIVDMHAEATSEKVAMGWYLDGRVSAVVGTHTHIPTADPRILPGGTAYVTDVGMVGPYNSVIGVQVEPIIQHFLTRMPARFEVADGPVVFNAVLLEVDDASGQAKSIRRIDRML